MSQGRETAMEFERYTPLVAMGLRFALVLLGLLCSVSLSRHAWNALLRHE